MIDTSVLIVGQGPYGLSLANYMEGSGQEFTIVGKPMELWRKHTFTDASLRSDMATSEIAHPKHAYSIQAFRRSENNKQADLTERVTVSEYRRYIDWVFNQITYRRQEDYVQKLFRHKDYYIAVLESGKHIKASKVVVATGVAHHLNIPSEFKSARDVIHAYHVGKIESLKKKKVLVVGAGQSALKQLKSAEKTIMWLTGTPEKHLNIIRNRWTCPSGYLTWW